LAQTDVLSIQVKLSKQDIRFMKRLIKELKILSLILPFLGCQNKFSKPIQFIDNLKEVKKIVIYYTKNGSDEIKVIEDPEKVTDFMSLFVPSKSQYSSKKNSTISPPSSYDGKIEIQYLEDQKLIIDYDLQCCYSVQVDNIIHYERFTYRLGHYLGDIHSNLQ